MALVTSRITTMNPTSGICHKMKTGMLVLDRTWINCNSGVLLQVPRTKHTAMLEESPVQVTLQLKPFKQMPGPRGLPVIGVLWDYMKKDGFTFNKMFLAMQSRADEYGPVVYEKIGHFPHVIVSDPKEYAKVMRVDGKYPNRIEMEPLAYYRRKKGMSLGTVSGQGEEWHRGRTVLIQKTLRPKEVSAYIPPMNEVSNDFMKKLMSLRTADGLVPNLEREMFKWAMEWTMLFEERIGCFNDPTPALATQFIENLLGFFKHLQPLMYNVPVYKVWPTKEWRMFEKYCDNVIDIGLQFVNKKVEAIQRQAVHGVGEDGVEEKSAFLTYLLSQKSLSPDEANSHAVDLLMGAVETTSNAIVWNLYCLAQNPDVQETIHQEIQGVLHHSDVIAAENLAQLQYIKACLKETFRLYPITFATSRIISQDIELGGYHVPAGTHCQANLYGMGRDPTLYTNPEEFRPGRWLRTDSGSQLNALANLTFGHGARMCLGRRLAEQEIYINLTKIIQNFRLEYNGPKIEPVLNTVMTPDQPVKIKFIPR